MVFEHEKFDVQISRDAVAEQLAWPGDGDLGFTGNRSYEDLRGLTWPETERIFSAEQRLIARIVAADSPEAEYEAILDELSEDFDYLSFLDLGIASTTLALSAAGCIPISSCNASAFGGHHHEDHPLVAFYLQPTILSILVSCAQDAGVGLSNGSDGAALVYSSEIQSMMRFAECLIKRQAEF